MKATTSFEPSQSMEVLKVKKSHLERTQSCIATEIPFTILVNDCEVATLLCSPIALEELSLGFLFTSGIAKSPADIIECIVDKKKWIAHITMEKTPDPQRLGKRLYTSGCGRGIMYNSIHEVAYRHPVTNDLKVKSSDIIAFTQWLQKCSTLYKETGSVHTAALSIQGRTPKIMFDDVGRHNAVDKVIGKALSEKVDFTQTILISSGRTSSEILHKARTCSIPINISRGAPTHQTILRARDMGITVIGFARSGNYIIYSHEDRICLNQ